MSLENENSVDGTLAIYLDHVVKSVQAQRGVPDSAWTEILGDDFGDTARIAFAILWEIHLDGCDECRDVNNQTNGTKIEEQK